ncbi:MAG: tRNA lysidine(34) synthetase TilS [Eubacterium sp.]|nr:tRNA lysidine(34) synthetase TilS [Eubacterium sp.]
MNSRLKDRFRDYIDREDLIHEGDILIVAVSGGADSICLFHLLSDISSERSLSLITVHVHHGIRGEEADRDALFVRDLDIERTAHVEKRVDAPSYAEANHLSEEEAARLLRYKALEDVREQYGASGIVLAHHGDDQAETILLNLIRGTGVTGLAGMRPKSGDRIRPLLFATRKEILEYLRENNIDFVEDSTNNNLKYTRNKIRHELIPLAESIYPGAAERISALASDIFDITDFIRETAENELEKTISDTDAYPLFFTVECDPDGLIENNLRSGGYHTGSTIQVHAYLGQPPVIRQEWLRIAVEKTLPGRRDISRSHYQAMDAMIMSEQSSGHIDLPGGYFAEKRYDEFVIGTSRMDETPVNAEKISFYAELTDNNFIFNEKKHDFFVEKGCTKFFDYGKIENGLVIRHPEEGDYIEINQKRNRKLLSRFFIDSKVPAALRPHVPVLADGKHVLFVYPDRMSEWFKVTEDTGRVLVLRWETKA